MTAELFKKIKKMVQASFLAAVVAVGGVSAYAYAEGVEKQGSREGINVTEINGVKCRPKTRMKTYLFMGVDNKGDVSAVESEEDSSGQCDVLQLLVIDQNANTYAIVPINRNTITAVKSLTALTLPRLMCRSHLPMQMETVWRSAVKMQWMRCPTCFTGYRSTDIWR